MDDFPSRITICKPFRFLLVLLPSAVALPDMQAFMDLLIYL